MLTENDDIDRLFFQKLGKFEKAPPPMVWGEIEKTLNSGTKIRRIEQIKKFGVAATVVLAVMAGWRITNSFDTPGNASGTFAGKGTTKQKNEQVPSQIGTPKPADNSNEATLLGSGFHAKEGKGNLTKMASFAAFAANAAFIGTEGHKAFPKSGDSVFADASGKIEEHLKLVEKLASWIENSVEGKTIDPKGKVSGSNGVVEQSFGQNPPDRTWANTFKVPETKMKGEWSLKAEYTRGIKSHSRNYGPINGIQPSDSYPDATDKTATNSFSAGILTGYNFGNRVTVRSGIVYNNISQSTQDTGNLSINFSKSTDPDNSEGTILKQSFEYIEIPMRVICKLNERKFGISVTGGLSPHVLVGNKAVLLANGAHIGHGKTSNVRSVVYSGELGLELRYEITNRLAICVEPRFKHYINSLSTNKSAGFNPNQFEIATGLQYNFN